jgi:hypothetical protein
MFHYNSSPSTLQRSLGLDRQIQPPKNVPFPLTPLYAMLILNQEAILNQNITLYMKCKLKVRNIFFGTGKDH